MSVGKAAGALALILSIVILWQIRQVLLLVFAAIVLAIALNRLVQRLQWFQINRFGAVLLSVLLLITAFTGIIWVMVPPFADQSQQLLQFVPRAIDQTDRWINTLTGRLPLWATQTLPDFDDLVRQLQPLANRLINQSFLLFSNSLSILLETLLVLVLAMMFLANPQAYCNAVIYLFPAFYRERARAIFDHCERMLGGWLASTVMKMGAIALLSSLGLWLLQIPVPLAQGVLAGLLTFIPNIGPALSVLPPMSIAWIHSPWRAIAVLVLYIAIQQGVNRGLVPQVAPSTMSLLPALTLTTQIILTTVFGFLGLLLALPLTIVGQVWLRELLIRDILNAWSQHRHTTPPLPDGPRSPRSKPGKVTHQSRPKS